MTDPLDKFKDVDLENLIKDEILAEFAAGIKEQRDRHLLTTLYGSNYPGSTSYEENGEKYIIVHNDAYQKLTEATDNSFLGKLKYGWKLFYLSYQDWLETMMYDDYAKEFFEYLGSCEIYE